MYSCRPGVDSSSRVSSSSSHKLTRSTKDAQRAAWQVANSNIRLSLTCSAKAGLLALLREAGSAPRLLFTMTSRSRTVHTKLRERWALSMSEYATQ